MEGSVLESSQRQKIELYLAQYCITELLDEVLNEIVEALPSNPYVEMAKWIGIKTRPEVLDASVYTVLGGQGCRAIEATVITNLGTFSASECVASSALTADAIDDIMEPLKKTLIDLNPAEGLARIDEVLMASKVPPIATPLLRCLSMAFCRAAARHHGLPLYRYISKLASSAEMCIPMPLATLLTLEDGQTISCLPSQAGSFSLALDTIRDAAEAVRKMVARQPQVRPNSYGAICIGNLSLEDAFGGVRKVIKESGLDGGVLLGADTRAASNIRSATEFTYGDVGATSSAVAGADKCAGLVSLWKDAELFSIEDPVASSDPSASTFKPKVTAVLNTMAREGSSLSHSFAFQGIGGSEGCVLQIIADEGVSSMEDLVAMDDGFNAVNLRMDKFRCVSDALAFASSARAMRLALIVGVPEGLGVTTDSFAADLAVGLGVGQFAGGGLESGEYAAGYNRLLSIQIESESISFVRRYFRT